MSDTDFWRIGVAMPWLSVCRRIGIGAFGGASVGVSCRTRIRQPFGGATIEREGDSFMSYRARARRRVRVHGLRVAFLALLAATFLVSASPAAAWQTSGRFAALQEVAAPEILEIEVSQGSFSVPRYSIPGEDGTEIKQMSMPAPAVALGQVIANTAMAYLGYPYVAAGNGPGGFDCSGFTQYIVGITTGVWISHAVEAQPWSAGYWVDYGNWMPGDLIFFQNTYRAGISHVGIYIGDGLIVHAENYDSGVTIDSIYSSYYGPRYYGAVRIG
jgi:cell wall-associated NlpC family hydrolase